MQRGNALRIRSVSTEHFTGALAQNAAEVEHIVVADLTNNGGGGGLAAGGHMRSWVHELRLQSVQNLAWAVELYGSLAGTVSADIDANLFLARWEFLAASADKDTGDSFYKYYAQNLGSHYQDMDLSGTLHIRLINLDAVAKIAGAAGAVVVELSMEPTQGI